jgi:hypothetical protein
MATVSVTGNQKPAKLCPEFPLTLAKYSKGEKDREQDLALWYAEQF